MYCRGGWRILQLVLRCFLPMCYLLFWLLGRVLLVFLFFSWLSIVSSWYYNSLIVILWISWILLFWFGIFLFWFWFELEARNNNKEICDIKQILNTIATPEVPQHKKDIPQCMRCQQYGHTKNYCNRSPACVKCAKNHLTIHCPYSGKIEEVKCYNCNWNHPASYKGCEIRRQLQRKLFPPLRNKSFNNHQPRQSITVNDTTLTAQYEPNAIIRSINPQGNRSYAQVTQNISQPTLINNQNQNNNIEDATDIKEMLKQSIKSTEMLGKMVSELNATLRQQVQQTTVMLQLLTNLLSEK